MKVDIMKGDNIEGDNNMKVDIMKGDSMKGDMKGDIMKGDSHLQFLAALPPVGAGRSRGHHVPGCPSDAPQHGQLHPISARLGALAYSRYAGNSAGDRTSVFDSWPYLLYVIVSKKCIRGSCLHHFLYIYIYNIFTDVMFQHGL